MTSDKTMRPAADPAGGMRVRVFFFGQTREAAGVSELDLQAPSGATVAEAAERIGRAHPAVAPHLARCSFAINQDYAARDDRLQDGDELAVIPPIGGG